MNRTDIFDEYNKPVTCIRCGGAMIFKGVGEYECEACGNVEYDDYGVARNYLEQHRGATVVEIAAATGLPQSKIQTMLREERLQIAENSRVFLKCMSCGVQIRSGNYCPVCAKLAAAAAAKKKADISREARQKNMVGYENEARRGQEGARRFMRGDDR